MNYLIIALLVFIILLLLGLLIYLPYQAKSAQQQQDQLLQLRLATLQQELNASQASLKQISTILLHPFQRGKLGNTHLDQLLALYLPKDKKAYQLEYHLKKPTGKGGNFIVDAIVFGIDGKNNLAIDSKFPLENFLLLEKDGLSEPEKKELVKKFKGNLKEHIKKVAEYVSEIDGTEHAIIFIPSEVIFAKINEQAYYEIIEFALSKKVSLCSPVTLAIVINQVWWVNKTVEQYRSLDSVLKQLKSFWVDFGRWQERWDKIQSNFTKLQKSLVDFDISVQKISQHGQVIKDG